MASLGKVRREHHRLGCSRRRGPGQPSQVGRHGRAEERNVGQAATQLLGHHGHLDRRRPGASLVRGGAQLAPARGRDRGVELGHSLGVVEVGHHVRARAGPPPGRPSRAGPPARARVGRPRQSTLVDGGSACESHSLRNVRRNTLPDGVRGMRVDEHHRAQVLVGGERVRHQRLQVFRADAAARLELDGGDRYLARPLVGDAEDGAVEHRRVAVQHGLDLGRRHLESAHLDHLLAAVGEMDPALGLEPTHVAGAVPPFVEGRRRGLVGQVPRHRRRAAHLDLPGLTRRKDGARVQVDHPQGDVADRQPGRVEPPGLGTSDRVGGDHRDLARAVGRQPAHAGALGHRLGHRRRHRRRPPHDVAQRGEVVALELRMVGHGQGDRGHRHLERHPVAFNRAQLLVEVEAPVQADRGRGLGGGEHVQQPEDVRRRGGDLKAVVVPEAERRDPVRRRQHHGAVGVADRLGQIGGARAEHQHGVVVLADIDARARPRCRSGPRCVPRRRRRGRGRPLRPGARRSSPAPAPSATPKRGEVRRSAASTSNAFQAGFRRTGATPTLLAPWTTATNSGRFDVIMATRSPGPMPRSTRARATEVGGAVEVGERPGRSRPPARRDDRESASRPTRALGA